MLSRSIWFLAAFLFFLLPPMQVAGEVLLRNVRTSYRITFSRVIFVFEEDMSYQVVPAVDHFKIKDPLKVIVEFNDLDRPPEQLIYRVTDPLIREIRFVVLETKVRAEIVLRYPGSVKRHFHQDDSPRIVIDINQDPPETKDAKIKVTNVYSKPSQPTLSRSLDGKFLTLDITQSKEESSEDLINNPADLFSEEAWGVANIAVIPRIFGERLQGGIEIVYSPLDLYDLDPFDGFREYKYRRLRFDLIGEWGGFSYGFEHLYTWNGFEDVPGIELGGDLAGSFDDSVGNSRRSSLWLERDLWVFHITTFLAESLDEVDEDPDSPRVRNTEGGITIDLELASWPTLSLSFERSSSRRSGHPAGYEPENILQDTFSASVYYNRSNWDVTLSSTYALTKDRLDPDASGVDSYYEISGSYSPTSYITVIPTLVLGKGTYKWSGGGDQYISPMVSVSFTYVSIFDVCDLTVYGEYSGYKSDNDYGDATNLYGTVSLFWYLGETEFREKSLSLDISYYHYIDAIYPEYSYEDIRVLLTFKVASFEI